MKKLFLILLYGFFVSIFLSTASDYPVCIHVGGQDGHVQGIAYDKAAARMYFSFTTRFIVADTTGKVIGSIDRIHGHLGALTFDSKGRKVYATLECKDDEIGAGISNKLGKEQFTESTFYIAEIDVDSIKGTGAAQEDVLRRINVLPANEDYRAEVMLDGKAVKHRYGCSGIDGITIGPKLGNNGKGEYLYVAYGIYSDTTRTDNDYQILLRYDMNDIRSGKESTPERYFVRTGNTSYGVQNLAYDSFSGLIFMAVYKGKKSQFPNFDLFGVGTIAKPFKCKLIGIPYETGKVNNLSMASPGWYFRVGSMGMCPLGEGWWYFAEPGIEANPTTSRTEHFCNAWLYQWFSDTNEPFKREPAR